MFGIGYSLGLSYSAAKLGKLEKRDESINGPVRRDAERG
jgi:hypothetical protein